MNDISTCGNMYQDGVERGLSGFRVGCAGVVECEWRLPPRQAPSFPSTRARRRDETRLRLDDRPFYHDAISLSESSLSLSLPPPLLRAMLTEFSFPTGFVSASVSAPIALRSDPRSTLATSCEPSRYGYGQISASASASTFRLPAHVADPLPIRTLRVLALVPAATYFTSRADRADGQRSEGSLVRVAMVQHGWRGAPRRGGAATAAPRWGAAAAHHAAAGCVRR
ncbi:hypothetical protein B0H14DRAFT_3061400 [Mycena olivaceomarginata]|nr:hypothetical protein B0H14DRAFT_3061400 [Mycena olivaceomarginata]